KKVDAGTDFSSTLNPTDSQFFFMIACVLWRTELTVVWYKILSLTPPLARTASAPLTHPASSSSLLSAAGWNLPTSTPAGFPTLEPWAIGLRTAASTWRFHP